MSCMLLATLVVGGCQVQTSGLLGRKTTSPSGGGGSDGAAEPSSYDSGSSGSSSSSAPSDGETDIPANWALYEVAAAPFAPKLGPTRPTWCTPAVMKQAEGITLRLQGVPGDVKMGATSTYGWSSLQKAALGLCQAPNGKRVQEQTGYFLQLFANQSGQDGPEVAAYLTQMLDPHADDNQKAFCDSLPKPDPEASAYDQVLAGSKREFYGCGEAESPFGESEWAFDRSVDPPQWLRALQVQRCFNDAPDDARKLAAWAACGIDAHALDRKKLEKEIAKLSPWAQTVARHEHAVARYRAARFEAAAKTMAKQDKAWQALLFDVPQRAWKAWTEDYAAHKAAMDAAFTFEDKAAKSKSAARGCLPDAWRDLQAYMRERKAKDLESAKQVVMSSVGNVLVRHLEQCLDVESDERVRDVFKSVIQDSPTARGPRHAITAAVLDQLAVIKTDREKFPAEPGWFYRYQAGGGGRGLLNRDLAKDAYGKDDTGGIVKSVKKVGDDVRVDFKTEKHKEREWWCEDTKKIIGWNSDGSPQYYRVCKEGGMVTVDDTHEPVLLPARFAAEIEPGRFVRVTAFSVGSKDQPGRAMAIEVWASPEKKKLVAYLGLAL